MEELLLGNEMLTIQKAMDIASMSLGVVFGYAATAKLLGFPDLLAGIRSYEMIPNRLALQAAGLLIICEGLISLTHLTGIGFKIIVPGATILLSIFTVMIASLLIRGERRPCLCFGAGSDDLIDVYSLGRVVLLLFVELMIYLYIRGNDEIAFDSKSIHGSLESLAIAVLVVAVIGWCLSIPKFRRAWHVVTS